MVEITFQRLIEKLKFNSHRYFNSESGEYAYDRTKVDFVEDIVKISREQGYSEEVDMTIENFYGEWSCEVHREIINEALLELVQKGDKGKVEIKNVEITETYHGARAYGTPTGPDTKSYKVNLELKLEIYNDEITAKLENPYEVRKPL